MIIETQDSPRARTQPQTPLGPTINIYPPAHPATTTPSTGTGRAGSSSRLDAYEPPSLTYSASTSGGEDGGLPEYTAYDSPELELDEQAKADATASTADVRGTLRTPSPTPEEARVLSEKTRMCGDWRRYMREWRRYANVRGYWTLAAIVAVIAFIAVFLKYQKEIVRWMRPFADWMHNTPGGWLIPIAIMFVLSFPPLFGHEIIAILVGDVWGIWIGFGIVAAGTIFGELGNFYAFKYFCSARGKKYEREKLSYALHAQVAREGGILVPTIMRLTFVPGHFLTAVFSTCGMTVWTFFVSATLSLPKQLAAVYIGVAQVEDQTSPTTNAIKAVVILATLAMSIIAARFINKRVDAVKARVIYARRKERQARMLQGEDLSAEVLPSSTPGGTDVGPDTVSGLSRTSTRAPPAPAVHMPVPQRAAVARTAVVPVETHRPQQRPRTASRMKIFAGRSGGWKKRRPSDVDGSEARGAGGGEWDGEGSGGDVELEVGVGGRALRARRHTEEEGVVRA